MKSRFSVNVKWLSSFLCAILLAFCAPIAARAATSQNVCMSLFVGSTTDLGGNCAPPTQPTTTPTTTPAVPPPETITSPTAIAGPAIIPNISDITVGYQGNSVIINWHNPTDTAHFSGVRIVRSPYVVPLDQYSGKVVYQGSGTYALDTGGIPGTLYYYTAFSYDSVGNFSSGAVFFAVWPSPQAPHQPQGQFPSQSLFPSLFPQSGGSSSPLLPPNQGQAPVFALTDLEFIQNGQFLMPAFPPHPLPASVGTVTADGMMPLVVAVTDGVVTKKIPSGLARVMFVVDILGKQSAYLLRESPGDGALEARIDLSTAPVGGYPFVVEFWPNRGEPFAVSGTLAITRPANFGGVLGFGISFWLFWQILILFILLAIFLVLVHNARRQNN